MANTPLLRSLLEAGLQAFRGGDLDAAKRTFERAITVAPDDADALHFFGVTLLQSGQPADALDFMQRAAQRKRNDPHVLGNLAQTYFALARYDEARDTFRKAGRLDPRSLQFPLGVANSFAMQGNLAAAEKLLQSLVARSSASSLVWFNLGNVQRDLQRTTDSLASFRRALAIDPQNVDARNSLACVLHACLQFEEAEREYRECIRLAPDYLLARCNLASVVMDSGRFDEAVSLCREVIRIAPDLPLAHSFLGAALGHQGRLLEALHSHANAARLSPHDAKVAQNYATALADSNHLMTALAWFTRALVLAPALDSTHQLLAYALLGHGRFTEGWSHYVHRPWPGMFRAEHPAIRLTQRLPAELRGKHICVVREQGLGDEIFFLRFAAPLHEQGARITYCASPKIRSLLSRSDCFAQVIDEIKPPADADEIILAGDLPYACSETPLSPLPSTFGGPLAAPLRWPVRIAVYWPQPPRPLPLAPLKERVAEMQERLARIGTGPYIGLTWRGGTPPAEQRAVIWMLHKEIGIASFGTALRETPATFIALQRKPQPGEIDDLSRAIGRPVHDFSDLNEDLEGMLALLSQLDDYIGVSNTNVHLRAGVRKTARVLVPSPPDWRWMMNVAPISPWFPGCPVYRQSLNGDWNAALEKLKRDLQATCSTPAA